MIIFITSTGLVDKTSFYELLEVYKDENFVNDLLLNKFKYKKRIELDDIYEDCQLSDFNEDLTFSIEKYNDRKHFELENKTKTNYEALIVSKIRLKYSINDELAILRQATTKPDEFAEYNAYVEQCKAEVKNATN